MKVVGLTLGGFGLWLIYRVFMDPSDGNILVWGLGALLVLLFANFLLRIS